MVKKIRYVEKLLGSDNMPLRAKNMASTMQRLIFTNKTVKKGEKIKQIGIRARIDMEKKIKEQIYLNLMIKVKK